MLEVADVTIGAVTSLNLVLKDDVNAMLLSFSVLRGESTEISLPNVFQVGSEVGLFLREEHHKKVPDFAWFWFSVRRQCWRTTNPRQLSSGT